MRPLVMVIDDDDDLRTVLCDALQGEGYDVMGFGDARQALVRLLAGPQPAVILLDLMMPNMNGWQFRQAQLLNPQIAGIPVIVLTAARTPDDRIAVLKSTAYLEKPLALDTLFKTVRRYARA